MGKVILTSPLPFFEYIRAESIKKNAAVGARFSLPFPPAPLAPILAQFFLSSALKSLRDGCLNSRRTECHVPLDVQIERHTVCDCN